ncbi:MAG: hypothetical protein WC497_00120 [Patescibacteria group bacterium]
MPKPVAEIKVKTKPSVSRVIVTILSVVFVASVFVLFGFIVLTTRS